MSDTPLSGVLEKSIELVRAEKAAAHQSPTSQPMIHAAIIEIMRAIEPIAKSQTNTQQGFNYRGIDQVYNAVHPHFAAHGVYSTSTIFASEWREGKSEKGKPYIHAILSMRFTFWAADGSSVSTEVVGEGVDYSGDKASNKAMSIADKYAILQLLKIPTAMVDADKPLHDNPPLALDAPAVGTRAARAAESRAKKEAAAAKVGVVIQDEITQAIANWKTMRHDDDATPEKWAEWVVAKTGRHFNVRQRADWTRGDMNKVHHAIEKEMMG